MSNHNFFVPVTDTDSIMIHKPDQTPFTEEEKDALLAELHSRMPDLIRWEDDGHFSSVIVLRTKNYVLYDGKKIKIKGSALKVTMKEPALKECIERFINSMLGLNPETPLQIYNNYVRDIFQMESIEKWTSKKTVTKSVLKPERSNEQKVFDAIQGKGYTEGDKVKVYFKYDGETVEEKTLPSGKISRTKKKNYVLKVEEDWSNDHATEKLLEKLYKNVLVFENVLDMSQFLNYSKVKNKAALAALLESK